MPAGFSSSPRVTHGVARELANPEQERKAEEARARQEELARARHEAELARLRRDTQVSQLPLDSGGFGGGGGVGTRTVSVGGGGRRPPELDALLTDLRGEIATGEHIRLPGKASLDVAEQDRARGLAFARAKEQAGQNAISALKSIRGATASRGIGVGSSLEGEQIGSAIGGAAGGLSDVVTAQAQDDAAAGVRASELQYQGGITQRGQDLQARSQAEAGRRALLSLYSNLLY